MTSTTLTDFRHKLVRVLTISKNLEHYAETLNFEQHNLTLATNKLPIIVKQIAQLFQTVVFWCYGYNQYIGTLQTESAGLIEKVSTMSKAGVPVGIMKEKDVKTYDIVAKPTFNEIDRLFTGAIEFCLLKEKAEEASIVLAKMYKIQFASAADPEWMSEICCSSKRLRNRGNYKVLDLTLDIIGTNPSKNVLNLACAILSRGNEEKLCYNRLAPEGDKQIERIKLNPQEFQDIQLSEEGSIMPKFWTTDISQFEQNPAASVPATIAFGADAKALI